MASTSHQKDIPSKGHSVPKANANSTVIKWSDVVTDATETAEHLRHSLEEYITRTFGHGKTESQTVFINELNRNGGLSFRLLMVYIFTLWYISAVEVHYYIILYSDKVLIRCELPPIEQCRAFNFSAMVDLSNRHSKQPPFTDYLSMEYCTYADHNYEKSVMIYGCDYQRIMDDVDTKAVQRRCNRLVKSIRTIYQSKLMFNPKANLQYIKDEFHLYCDDIWTTLFWVAIHCGEILSFMFAGFTADIYGRKRVFIIISLVHLVGFLTLFVPQKWCLVLGRFLTGAGRASQIILYLLFLEICNNVTLLWMGLLASLTFPITNAVVYLLYQLTKTWKTMHILNTCMLLPLPLGFWYITESPRWLMFVGKKEKAWGTLKSCGGTARPNINNLGSSELKTNSLRKILRSLKQPIFDHRLILCIIIWSFSSISLFIHDSFVQDNLRYGASNILWLVVALELLELVFNISAILLGRKATIFGLYCVLMFLDACIYMELPVHNKFTLVLFCCHLVISEVVFYVLIFYTSELFPTPYRATAICQCLTVYEVGIIFPEYLLKMIINRKWYVIQYCPIFVSTGACALLICLLPKTRNAGFPDEDREALYFENIKI